MKSFVSLGKLKLEIPVNPTIVSSLILEYLARSFWLDISYLLYASNSLLEVCSIAPIVEITTLVIFSSMLLILSEFSSLDTDSLRVFSLQTAKKSDSSRLLNRLRSLSLILFTVSNNPK